MVLQYCSAAVLHLKLVWAVNTLFTVLRQLHVERRLAVLVLVLLVLHQLQQGAELQRDALHATNRF